MTELLYGWFRKLFDQFPFPGLKIFVCECVLPYHHVHQSDWKIIIEKESI